MLVIEDFLVVEENVTQNNTFKAFITSVMPQQPTALNIYFYNFNFPDHIEYDKVTYAKFQYDYISCLVYDYNDLYEGLGYEDSYSELNRKTEIKEFYDEDKTLQVNDFSMELTFPTFYLGNRVEDNQFGDLEISNPEDFEYDCSILLGSATETAFKMPGTLGPMGTRTVSNRFDEIEILELHYENDGILYKCQVAGGKVDTEEPNEDFGQGNATDPDSPLDHLFDEDKFLGKVMNSVKDWFNGIWQGIVNWFKDMYLKYKIPLLIIGGIVLGGLLFVIFKNLFVVAKFLWTIVYGIGYLVFYPFILIYRAIDNKKNE